MLNGLSERGNTPDLMAILYFLKRKRFVGRRCLESPSLQFINYFMNQLRGEGRLRKSKTTTTPNWTNEIEPQTTNPSKIFLRPEGVQVYFMLDFSIFRTSKRNFPSLLNAYVY